MVRTLQALAVLTLALGGCNTPSVPIPPPSPDVSAIHFMSGATMGEVTAEGQPNVNHRGVRFYIYNVSRTDGVIVNAQADGSFTSSPFAGTQGDTLQFYFDAPDGRRSERICAALVLSPAPLIGSTCP
jgi:hypothetical protein